MTGNPSQPPEMDRVLDILLDEDHPYRSVMLGWCVLKAFEGNGHYDFEQGKFIMGDRFERLLNEQLDEADSLKMGIPFHG